jgi:glycosyltransferase involved in cell wall biosynthesis
VSKAIDAYERAHITGEVVVADNGSTDQSVAIARRCGAKIVEVKDKGYGYALMSGIMAAQGTYVIMGDADDSYDFAEIPRFVERLRQGYDLVQGCRLPSGGGTVEDGAMPWSHRWIGNPMFSWIARHWFHAPIHDVYCGMRGFRRQHFLDLNQRCVGMEFATEMIIKSSLYHSNISEIPITLHKDGRTSHAPHLKTIRDGWRTLRFFLIYSPRHLFLIPGIFLCLLGIVGSIMALPGISLAGVTFGAHTLLFSSLALICGFQSIYLSIITKTFAIGEGLLPSNNKSDEFFTSVSIEKILVTGIVLICGGMALLLIAINDWRLTGFGPLDYASTMRVVIPGATLTAIGFQTAITSFVMGMFRLKRL